MKRTAASLLISILLITLGIIMVYFKSVKTQTQSAPKRIIAKFAFRKLGGGLGEFHTIGSLLAKDNYLYVADIGNNRIQVLEIKY